MDGLVLQYFNSIPYVGPILLVLVETVLAMLFSSLIGLQRERRGHGAGLRTHVMVAIGACLIMQVSISAPGFEWAAATRDPARLAAQVVSGIGFLGAGTIIQNGTNIRGLTTAATIWLCGGIGLACGSGYFSVALIATAVSFLSLIALSKLETYFTRKSPKIIMIINHELNYFKEILSIADSYGVAVKDIHTDKLKGNEEKHRVSIIIMPVEADTLNDFARELNDTLKPEDFSVLRK